jgi:hypothetical protein
MNNFQLPKTPEIQYFQSAEYERRIEQARYLMRARPFIERFRPLYNIAIVGKFFFPAISVLTGIAFLYGYINGAINSMYISIVFAILILVMVELTKNYLLANGLQTFFSNSGKSNMVFGFAFIFSIASFIMSYNGAELLVKNLDTKKQTIQANSGDRIGAVQANYDKLINEERQKVNELKEKAKRQWKGLNTPEQNKLLLKYEENIQQFIALKEKETDLIRNEKTEQLNEAETTVNYNAYIFKILAACNEFLTILSIIFCAFYNFKVVRENLDYQDFKNEPEKYNGTPAYFTAKAIEPMKVNPSLNTNDRPIVSGFFREPDGTELNDQGSNDHRAIDDSRTRKCEHCGAEFTYRHWAKKYCSDACRIRHWEERTGQKLKYEKKKA